MTTLVVDELTTTLTQTVNFNKYYRIHHIGGIKIKILMYNAPAGTFTLSIKSGATTLASKDFTSTEIKADLSTSDNYAYLYKEIVFSELVALKNGSYDLVLSSSGYSYSSGSFLGWIKSHESIFNELEDAFVDYATNPLDVLIYENMREDLWG